MAGGRWHSSALDEENSKGHLFVCVHIIKLNKINMQL